ncbi:MAG: hypothetical protein R6W91_00730 [Thermoplasmata archaeon]
MNLEQLPKQVREDIEDQSLEVLEKIASKIVVIGGWGVRAHLGEGHGRYTLDVDGVTDNANLAELRGLFATMGFKEEKVEWGIKFFKRYEPDVEVPEELKDLVAEVELRMEISPPRIKEYETHHYFEFSLTEYVIKNIPYHRRDGSVKVRVPPLEDMTAVKLGLPVDYKHNHDAAMLLRASDVEKVIHSIKSNDDWASLVMRRMPKLKGRISQTGRLENTLAIAAGLDIRQHVKTLDRIASGISE